MNQWVAITITVVGAWISWRVIWSGVKARKFMRRIEDRWREQFIAEGVARGFGAPELRTIWPIMVVFTHWHGVLEREGPRFEHILMGEPGWGWDPEDLEVAAPACARAVGQRLSRYIPEYAARSVGDFVGYVLGAPERRR